MMQSSDMFKKIKSIFVLEDGTEAKLEDGKKSNQESTPAPPTPTVTQRSTVSTSSGDQQPDAKFTDLLLKAIESNNLDGFDYLEYKNSLRSIVNVIPDEGMRYKSAFEMAKTMGLTKEKLIQSGQHYLGILANEDKKFKDALENQKTKQIQGRADQLSAIEKAIVDKQQMIEKLTKEIADSTAQLDAVRTEINDAVVKIDLTNQQFVASYNLVYSQIYEDIEKIKTNL